MMNNRARLRAVFFWLPESQLWRDHLLISLVFLLLLIAQWFSLDSYWRNTLQPRLYLAAETQATILAQSQAAVLVETLEHGAPAHLPHQLLSRLREILIVTDPSTGTPMMTGMKVAVDYDRVAAVPGSLDLSDGNLDCDDCFLVSLPLINNAGELLGVADFSLSNHYYLGLSTDMKSRLFRESALVLVLLLIVWATLLALFHRLHQAKRLVEASDRAKSRFMANVTHELRTPLNGILGYTQLFKAEPELMREHGKGIETIDRCADHLLLMINDIIDFSRDNENSLTLHPQEIHLPAFLQALVEMADVRARIKGIEFRCEFPEQLPVRVRVDDKRLRQVLLNLLSNAVKFTNQGYICLALELISLSNDKVLLRIRVTDTGIGMEACDLSQIFIPFHQIDNAATRAEGSGLGLSISQKLVRLMGSELKVSSVPGKGSSFWFDLQLLRADIELADIRCPAKASLALPDADHVAGDLSMVLPPAACLQGLIEAGRQHNILQLRRLQQQLEQQLPHDNTCAPFVAALKPYISAYRFKSLVAWLESFLP